MCRRPGKHALSHARAYFAMRGDIVYRIYGVHGGRQRDVYFGAFRSRSEADAEVTKLCAREMNGDNWAKQYHNLGFAIREMVVEIDFEIPSSPKPRDKYVIKCAPKQNRPGTWNSTIVEVFRRPSSPGELKKICEYERNHSLFQTFEPFRQRDKEFALISRDYTKTAVLDLASGTVIAEEIDDPDAPPEGGFCPVGFYVPDWWDVNDGSLIPGSEFWSTDHEWPNGDFGFVWGCHWGDDTSWKVQHVDLSRVQQGIVRRDERFGYLELATFGFESPCLILDPATIQKTAAPHFIELARRNGVTQVTFEVEMKFSLETGRPEEWQRLKTTNFE